VIPRAVVEASDGTGEAFDALFLVRRALLVAFVVENVVVVRFNPLGGGRIVG
jgi:hypothetical protein